LIARSLSTHSTIQEPITADIADVELSGDGVARVRGRTIAVPFTIPGERVRVATRRTRDGRTVGELVEIVRASPSRVAPRCRHFAPDTGPACGGCSWQHIAYPEQLRLKTALVDRLVRAVVPDAPATASMVAATPDDPWHYRHKVHFAFDAPPDRHRIVIGHYVRGSRRVLPVVECPVHAERGNAIAFAMREACAKTGAARTLKSLAVRVSAHTAETMATLVVSSPGDMRVRAATNALLAGPAAPSSMHVNVHPKGDAFIFGDDTKRLAGPARLREEIAGVSFLISPTAFFQTNVAAAQLLVRLVLAAVPDGCSVLDLYAGAGLFALPLARRGQTVVAVEGSAAAVADGIASRDLNRIPEQHCRFIASPVERVVGVQGAARRDGVRHRPSRIPRADAVVLDPPREGCDAAVLDAVFARIAPRTAVYVSCNPETLARDLAIIVRRGYMIRTIQPVDMFPHTAHVETVVTMVKRT
jgi:23S rRNA (uracil1939-C5)-methyltransferase